MVVVSFVVSMFRSYMTMHRDRNGVDWDQVAIMIMCSVRIMVCVHVRMTT